MSTPGPGGTMVSGSPQNPNAIAIGLPPQDVVLTDAQGNKVIVPAGQMGGAPGPQGIPGPQGPHGPQGAQGPAGMQGATGSPGTGVYIKGSYSDPSQLPPIANVGDAYMISPDLWVFDGTQWSNMGPLQGPAGPDGPQGVQGPQGPAGAAGAQGATGPQGAQGPVGPQGPPGDPGPPGPGGITSVTTGIGSSGLLTANTTSGAVVLQLDPNTVNSVGVDPVGQNASAMLITQNGGTVLIRLNYCVAVAG